MLVTTNADEDVDKRDPLTLLVEMKTMPASMEISVEMPSKPKLGAREMAQ